MGQEGMEIIRKASRAFSRQEYAQASGLFTQVLTETRGNLRQVTILSRKSINAIQEFAFCSRLAGKAMIKDGQVHEAERVYLDAAEKLKPFISNLNNRLPYRALVMTEFKLLFYELAGLYVSNAQLDKLNTYVEKNTPVLESWARELQMVSQSERNLN